MIMGIPLPSTHPSTGAGDPEVLLESEDPEESPCGSPEESSSPALLESAPAGAQLGALRTVRRFQKCLIL
eukprot:CAMPEP_0119418784 /NCGR_PEP_ID=MMETSP1335-20130426/19142_1 /TAXON_ID=259385 /ORGANISM="Chrysoculter rhomboideus, Strain RCC1486" /LENGTH=69 /DNA_ID=CAMNT_0007444053 /DNA_START=177 /DNA_END=386 /DNA_ORIENTATION=+